MKILLDLIKTPALAFTSFICIGTRPPVTLAYRTHAPIIQPADWSGPAAQSDAVFLADAAVADLMEVELGQLVQLNSLDPVLKDLGARMIKDHGQGADRIKALCAARNIKIPAVLSGEQQKIKEGLQKKTGTEFDKEYINLVIDDHIKSIRQFEKEAAGGSDKEVKTFADSSLQMLHTHLDAAQNYKKTSIKSF